MFDMIVRHSDFSKYSNEGILDALDILYPERDLYSLSLDWRKNKQYVMKAKGVQGDVLVGWSEVGYGKCWADAWELYEGATESGNSVRDCRDCVANY